MNKLFSFILASFLILGTSLSFGQEEKVDTNPVTRSYVETAEKNIYYEQAVILKGLLAERGLPVNVKVVVKLLKAIDRNIPKFFPNGPFTRNDFIALAWLESALHQHENGTHGEKGIFQIMPDEFRDYGITDNFYDIDINTKMCFRVLKGKYKRWHEYKKAIIAYNGVVHLKSGQWSEKYWRAFYKRRKAVDLALGPKI